MTADTAEVTLRDLAAYVTEADAILTPLERLTAAAGDAAARVSRGQFKRAAVITVLVLAAEIAGIGRREAEKLLIDTFEGVPR